MEHQNWPAGSSILARAKPTARTRVSNGKALFLEAVDGRSLIARRYREILGQLVSDIGGDPSEAQSILTRRAATLAVWCEQREMELAKGEEFNIADFTSATNTLRRVLNDLGLERRMRDITPSIDSYLRQS
jgi:hypothetical protein